MKSFYITSLGVLLALSSVAQWKDAPVMNLNKLEQISTENNGGRSALPQRFENYERGDAFWFDNFDDPEAWTIENGEEYGWVIGDTENGWWFRFEDEPFESTSGGNNAFVWNGDPTQPGASLLAQQHVLTRTDAIDISGLETAQLEFEYYGAAFVVELMEIQVSNDAINWFTVDDFEDIPATTQASPNNYTANPALRSVNISPYVAGQNDLYLRFSMTTEEAGGNTGVIYGWYIDDVALRTVPDNSIGIIGTNYTDGANTGIDMYGVYTPFNQASLVFRADIENFGGMEQTGVTMTVFVNGEEIGETDAVTIAPLETDSLILTGYMVPETVGEYEITYQINMPNEDIDPSDNISTDMFMVDEFQMGRDNGSVDFLQPTADFADGEWRAGPFYEIFEDGMLYAIDVALWDWDEFEPGGEIRGFLMDPDAPGIDDGDVFEFTEAYEVPEQNLNTIADEGDLIWTTLVLESPYEVFAGDLVHATVGGFNTDFRIIGSETDQALGGITFESGEWINYVNVNWMVRLNYNENAEFTIAVEEENTFDFSIGQNFPNPATDVTRVAYDLETAGTVNFELFDVTGKLVMNQSEGTLPAGRHFIEINVSDLPAGVYQYSVIVNDQRITRPMMVK